MTPLLWWLVHTLIGASLIMLVALGLMRCVGQPASRQRLGEMGLLAALSVGLLSPVQPTWWVIPWSKESVLDARVDVPAPAVDDVVAAPDWDQFLYLIDQTPPGHNVDAGNATPIAAVDSSSVEQAAGVSWGVVVLTGYAFVAGIHVVRWFVGILSLRRLVRRSQAASEILHVACLESWTGRRTPRVLVSEELEVPISFGVVRPTVVIPATLLSANRPTELEWAVRHELTHLERHDAWSNGLFLFGQILFFPLPWFYWLRRTVRLCQEFVADAAASRRGNVEDYAEFLLRFTTRPAAAALVSAASGSDLTRRITMLLKETKSNDKRGSRWQLALGTLALMALAVGAAGISAQDKDKDKKAKGLQFEIQLGPDGVAKDVVWQFEAAPAKPVQAKDKEKALVQLLEKFHKQLQGPADQLDLKEIRKEIAQAIASMKGQNPEQMREVHVQLQNLLGQLGGGKRPAEGAPKVTLFKAKGHEELHKAVEKMIKDGKFDKETLERELAKMHEPHFFTQPVPPPAFNLELDLGNRFTRARPKLGVSVEAPSDVLVEQLALAKGKGLMVIGVAPESPAEKSGIKINDVLIKVGGKDVPNTQEGLQKILEEVKGEIEAVIIRRGKQETIKGIKLGIAVSPQAFLQTRQALNPMPPLPPQPPVPPGAPVPPAPGVPFRIQAVLVGGEPFTSVIHQGNTKITVNGTGKGKNLNVKSIVIEEGNARGEYDAVDKVPDNHRARVEQMIEMGRR